MPTFTGTDGDDNLVGTGGADTFYPLLGSDTVDGLGDNDTLIVDYSHAPFDPFGGTTVPGPFVSTISSNGGAFSGRITGPGAAVTFSNIENLQVTLHRWGDRFVIDAGALALGATIWVNAGTGLDTLEIDLSHYVGITLQADTTGLTGGGFGTFLGFERFVINLSEGADTVTTDADNDVLTGNGGNDVLNSGGGNDILTGDGGDDVLHGGAGDDMLSGGAGVNSLDGGDGDDQLFSTSNDTVDGGVGNDLWSGNYGWLTSDFSMVRDQAAGSATLSTGTTLVGVEHIAALVTGSGNDVFVFGEGDGASVDAGAGRDSLTITCSGFASEVKADGAGAFKGVFGYNHFTGIEVLNFTGLGSADTIAVDPAPLLSGAILRLDGAGGSDTLILDLTVFASISFVVAANGTLTTNVPATFLNFENYQISATGNADTLVTGAGNDIVHGNGGNDVISTGAGNDLLDGGAGDDSMTGGAGNDTYIVNDAGDSIVEKAGEGLDEVFTSLANFSIAAIAIEDLTGTSDGGQTLTGNALGNRISGGAGNDILIGMGGNDLLIGKAGNDIYYISSEAGSILESAGEGTDIVYASISFVLVDSVYAEVETLAASDPNAANAIDLTGNTFGQKIVGNAGANVLTGGGGADILDGKGGADTFRYVDTLDSTIGAYDRILAFQSGVDKIDLSAVSPTGISWTQQTDASDHTIYQFVAITLPFNNAIFIRVDGTVTMSDFITVASNLNLVGTAADGNELLGGSGNDTLDGLAGADTMLGRAGNDTYYVDHANDAVVEVWNQGNDAVYTSTSYALSAGTSVELLSVASRGATTALTLTGNDFDQTLIGNAGTNVLVAGGGYDRLVGGAGSDWLQGGAGNDTFVFETVADSRAFAMRSDGHKIMPDVIADYSQGFDRIDLNAIDAIAGTGADDAFTFIGTAAFSHQAGQLRFETTGGQTAIFADVDGDGLADMQIMLQTPVTLTVGDFLL